MYNLPEELLQDVSVWISGKLENIRKLLNSGEDIMLRLSSRNGTLVIETKNYQNAGIKVF